MQPPVGSYTTRAAPCAMVPRESHVGSVRAPDELQSAGHRHRDRIVDDVHRMLRESLRATPDELVSLLRVVRSNIGLSFSMISSKAR